MTKKKKQQKKQPLDDKSIDCTVVPKDIEEVCSARRLAYVRALNVIEIVGNHEEN